MSIAPVFPALRVSNDESMTHKGFIGDRPRPQTIMFWGNPLSSLCWYIFVHSAHQTDPLPSEGRVQEGYEGEDRLILYH